MNYRDRYKLFSLRELMDLQDDLEKYLEFNSKASWWDTASMFFCGFFMLFSLISFFGVPILFIAAGVSFGLMCICLWYTEYLSNKVRFYSHSVPTWDTDKHEADLAEAVRRKLNHKEEPLTIEIPKNVISVDFSAKR